MYNRKTLWKVYNCYFPETTLKQFRYCFVHYRCTHWHQKEETRVFISGMFMLLSHIQLKGISIDSMQKKWSKVGWIMGLQQSIISHVKAIKIVHFKCFHSLNKRNLWVCCSTLPEALQSSKCQLNWQLHLNTQKQYFRLVPVSQSIVLQFLKEV